METFSALLALYEGNQSVIGGFPRHLLLAPMSSYITVEVASKFLDNNPVLDNNFKTLFARQATRLLNLSYPHLNTSYHSPKPRKKDK